MSEWSGKTGRWFCVVLIMIMSYEVIMRHAFDSPNIWGYELPIMLGAALYAMGWSYVHRHEGHIRIDVIYIHLPSRIKAVINVLGYLFLFFPLIALLAAVSILYARRAWVLNEVFSETFWYPPAAPIRTVVAIGICLFAIQGIAQFLRHLYLLINNRPYD